MVLFSAHIWSAQPTTMRHSDPNPSWSDGPNMAQKVPPLPFNPASVYSSEGQCQERLLGTQRQPHVGTGMHEVRVSLRCLATCLALQTLW